MSKPRDRQPLDGEASPDLKRVLEALREDGPSSDEMQRMAHKLDAWLETPAAASGQGQGLLSRPLGKIGLGVLASGALLALLPYLLRNSNAHEQPPEIAAAPHALAPASSGTAPALRGGALRARELPAPAAAPQPAHVLQAAPQPPPAAEPEVTHGTRYSSRKHGAHARTANPAAAEHPGLEPVSPAVPLNRAATASTSATSGTTEPEDSTSPAARTTPSEGQVAPSAETAVAPTRPAQDARAQDAAPAVVSRALPLDEAGLLHRARQLAHERPAEALRLLDEHKRRFARGMLAPEREVLAIEILRAQQRNAEARTRLGTFRAQYPDSVYLERLEHP